VYAADLAVLGPHDVVGILKGVQRVKDEHCVVPVQPSGFFQRRGWAESEKRFPAVAVGDATVIEADAVLMLGEFGDECPQHLEGVLAAVFPQQMPSEAFAMLAVDLPAGLGLHARNFRGKNRVNQVVLASGRSAGDHIPARRCGGGGRYGVGECASAGHAMSFSVLL
jgi:hypothetical protein